MGSLFTSMYTGVSGLKVNQTGLNTTGHNLTNVHTVGYTRQQVLIKDSFYNSIGMNHMSSMQVGLGTDMSCIRQVRDQFLDKAYRVETGRMNFYESQYESVMEIENLFGELEGEPFQDTMTNFWSAMQELSKEPDSIVKRDVFVENAVTFVERAQLISKQLQEYQTNLNRRIMDQVDRINQIGDDIKKLNGLIQRYEIGGEAANDYRDARNELLDELGGLVKMTYKENENGGVTVNIEGTQFITEDMVFKMGVQKIDEKNDLLKVVWQGNGGKDVFKLEGGYATKDNTDLGSLKGLLVSRGEYAAKYTDIPVRENFDSDADYDFAVRAYNSVIDPSAVMSVQAQFDQLVHGIVTMINDTLSPNGTVPDFIKNLGLASPDAGELVNITIPADSGTPDAGTVYAVDTDAGEVTVTPPAGAPYKIKLEDFHLWDEGTAPVGMDEDATTREALFNRKKSDRYTEATMTYVDTDGNTQTKTVYIYNEEKKDENYSLFTIDQIEVNPNILSNSSKLPLSGNKYQGQADGYDIKVCEKMITAWGEKFATLSPNSLLKNSFSDYYRAMISDLSNRGKVINSKSENQKSMVADIDSKRQAVAGVSSDEELSNMIKFQQAYNANARYVNVIDEMLQHIIERLG